jgi:large subunit ribosomal protein L13
MGTYSPKPGDIAEKWFVVDAEGQIVGRLAARIAAVLRGKHLPTFAPHWNMQTHVIVVNADKIAMTGRKMRQKKYIYHTGHPHGLKTKEARTLHAEKPGEVLRQAIHGMLPKTRLGQGMRKRLRIFVGPTHTHAAQNPEPLTFAIRKAREE